MEPGLAVERDRERGRRVVAGYVGGTAQLGVVGSVEGCKCNGVRRVGWCFRRPDSARGRTLTSEARRVVSLY